MMDNWMIEKKGTSERHWERLREEVSITKRRKRIMNIKKGEILQKGTIYWRMM